MNALEELELERIEWENIEALNICTEQTSIRYIKGDDIEELKKSLGKINYDCGFGSQELYGLILMNDKTWYDRYEYDGAELWIHHICPTKEGVLAFTINNPWI